MKVAVIETQPLGLSEKAKQTLRLAGAEIPYAITFDWAVDPDFSAVLTEQDPGDKPLPSQKLNARVAEALGGILVHGKSHPVFESLVEAGFIRAEGSVGTAVDAVVILGGSEEDRSSIADSFDLPLAEAFLTGGVEVVAAEFSDAEYSYLEMYKLKGCTTIDNADSTIGQTSMVFALAGKKGYYGTGATAERLIPELQP